MNKLLAIGAGALLAAVLLTISLDEGNDNEEVSGNRDRDGGDAGGDQPRARDPQRRVRRLEIAPPAVEAADDVKEPDASQLEQDEPSEADQK